MNELPPGDDPALNKPSTSDFTVSPRRSTGQRIDISHSSDQLPATGLRKHNYYNAKNASSLIALIQKWQAMRYEDCYMPASALGLTPDSLRVKLNCARAFFLDHMGSHECADIVRRTEFCLTNLGVCMKLTNQVAFDFADVLKRGQDVVDPIAATMEWFNRPPPPRDIWVLKDLHLTPSQLEWFKQTLAQIKDQYEGDVNESQVVIVKLI